MNLPHSIAIHTKCIAILKMIERNNLHLEMSRVFLDRFNNNDPEIKNSYNIEFLTDQLNWYISVKIRLYNYYQNTIIRL